MRQERKEGSLILPSLVKPCLLPLNVLRSWWDVFNSGRISRPWETALEKEAIMQMLHLPHKDDRYALKCFPAGTSGKEPTCQCRRHKRQVRSLGWEDPLDPWYIVVLPKYMLFPLVYFIAVHNLLIVWAGMCWDKVWEESWSEELPLLVSK